MSSDFVHLHVHSEYSLLDGLGRTANLAKEAARLKQPALALTDHGVMHGAVEFFRNCKKEGVKPIIGVEAYMTHHNRRMGQKEKGTDKTRHHLLLLAQNMTGYKNLLKICSDAQKDGYYYKPRIDADYLAGHAEGLICTSGCMSAEIPWLLNSVDRAPQEEIARERLEWYLELFGRDRFFIELQEHNIPELTRINKTMFNWAKEYDLGMVVTNDVHYVNAGDASPHDTLLCVQTAALVTATNRMRMSGDSYYLKTAEEMKTIFRPLADLPDSAFTNSLKIAEMCNVDLEDSSFHLPELPPDNDKHYIPVEVMPVHYKESKDYAAFLRYLTDKGLKERYGSRADSVKVQKRKEHELKIINGMGFDIYYLIVWDLCRFARQKNIWWNVRGSGAGSIVAYAVGITLIDPLRHNLIFERFLNPGRISMPDFDLDYPDDQRKMMIDYTIERYGADRVAQIVSFGRMKARAAIRDVGRAMDIPLSDVNRLAKMITAIPGKPVTIDDALNKKHEFFSAELKEKYENDEKTRDLINTARSLEGVARHASVHAAAVIITDKPLTEYVPVMRAPRSTKDDITYVTQFEFPICESIGLLKVDFLGLSTLTVMRKASELIKKRHGIEFNLENIPMDNPEEFKKLPQFPPPDKAFELLASGNVTGVFQVESAGMRRMLKEMKPSKFEHIVAAISLFRPGPMEYIPTYIARMHGKEPVEFKHPKLETILSETYGIIVYQEQIIQIASQLAGYAPGDADQIRKAVGKKIKSKIEEHRSRFIDGAVNNGIDKTAAQSIYDDIEFFARYGFNKAHAADYALVTCQTAYLKANYPVEYMAALLTVERNNSEKVGMLASECQAMKIDILPPDVNNSFIEFAIEEQTDKDNLAIRFGLSAIKNVGESSMEVILAARAEEGGFTDIDEFCSRIDLRLVNRRGLEGLIKVGALDCFGVSRATLLAIIERMINLSSSIHKATSVGQASMFGLDGFNAVQTGSILNPPPQVEEISQKEILGWEKELVGIYLSAHPMQKYMATLKATEGTVLLAEINEAMHGKIAKVAGLIKFVRPHQTKKGDPMAFIGIEDVQTSREVVLFPRTYKASKHLLVEGALIMVTGKVDTKDGYDPKILADTITNDIVTYSGNGDKKPTSPPPKPTLPMFDSKHNEAVKPKVHSQSNGYVSPKKISEVAIIYQPTVQVQEQVSTPKVANEEVLITAKPAIFVPSPRVHITLKRVYRLDQDKHRLKQLLGVLTEKNGKDPFTIHITGRGGKTVEIYFPGLTTHYSGQLEEELKRGFGAELIWN